MHIILRKYFVSYLVVALAIFSCKKDAVPVPLFQKMDESVTHIDFTNTLSYDAKFNIYTYRNFYNGGGVAIGDINNDGLPDIFFTANMLKNRLYLNKGNFEFEDITEKAGIIKKGKWSTGVSMADVNGDGYLDIYVCNSGDIKGDNKQNELFINNGDLTFSEKSHEYRLDDKGFSTHAAFFDFDHDGDLDMYLLNNSFKAIGSFNLQNNERGRRDSLGGHKLYRNDGTYFTDVSEQAGIYGSIIGFGLGVTVGDINKDGWQDIYVSNDFFERDYLYVNQQDGTFKDVLPESMMSISNASMGADMADINNDCLPEIFVTEMLPEDEFRIKTNTTFENWNKYILNLKQGYHHQFTRNMLQLNHGHNSFSDIGRLGGVCATDWSWGALITDLDNDGNKDIFIANGIFQDLTNADYIQYISSESFFKEVSSGKADFKKLIDLIPSVPISNYAYRNNGDLTFTNKALEWGLSEPGFSNGSAYGDLDNDGDLDLVVNNVNMPSFVYRNESIQQHPENKFLKVSLVGEGKNTFGIGTKVTVYYNHTLSYQEQMPMRGFESTVDFRLNFGLGKVELIDSVIVEWPDGRQHVLKQMQPNQHIEVNQRDGVVGKKQVEANHQTIFTSAESDYGLDFIHRENEFVDFDRDKLIFHMLSREGPRMAKGDVNGDGLEDVYISGAKDQPGVLYEQTTEGRFRKSNEKLFAQDKMSEDTDAVFFDADGDGDADLYVCSGGNEFSPNATGLMDRLYLNEGQGKFIKSPQVLPSYIFESSSCVRSCDYDKDGDLDLFVGVRLKPFSYGYPCKGYILENNGKGIFKDVTEQVARGLKEVGMVTDAAWFDYDKDGDEDLVIAGEYMPIKLFRNEGGQLQEVTVEVGLGKSHGWWNRLQIADVNGDGYEDILGCNHGLNSRFKASEARPVRLYAGDFDSNGSVEQIISSYNGEESYPMVLKHDLVSVIPSLKKKYLKYESYKGQTIEDVFSPEQLENVTKLEAYRMESSVMLNRQGKFEIKALPVEAQLSPMYGVSAEDFDGDGKVDLLLGGNFYESKPEVGIYDGSYGVLLKGDGKGEFEALDFKKCGIHFRAPVRDIIALQSRANKIMVFALNNDSLKVFKHNNPSKEHIQNSAVAKK